MSLVERREAIFPYTKAVKYSFKNSGSWRRNETTKLDDRFKVCCVDSKVLDQFKMSDS